MATTNNDDDDDNDDDKGAIGWKCKSWRLSL
jgi:hypothetical protein